MTQSVYIVIPVYNEAAVIASVVRGLRQAGWNNIIVVDDGSGDATSRAAAAVTGTVVLRHRLNRGKGAATKTGIEAAKLQGARVIVTMDGDGQHDPADIRRLVKPILHDGYDVVLGCRAMNRKRMPLAKIVANHIGNFVTLIFCGKWVNDSQSGLRAYSRHAAELMDTLGARYEYDSEVVREIRRHDLRYREIPIRVHYTEYAAGKQMKQGFVNGIRTVIRMVVNRVM